MGKTKSLIIYFSRADENYAVGNVSKGNTEYIAEYIQQSLNADIFKVERKIPYSKDYNTCIYEAQNEQQQNLHPELVEEINDISCYDNIFIGSPVYWGLMPQPLVTQLEKLNFTGKNVYPFVTHEGSGLAGIPNQIKSICKNAKVYSGLAIKGSLAKNAKQTVTEWLRGFKG